MTAPAPAPARPPGTTPSGLAPLPVRTILLRSMVVLVATALAVLAIVGWRWWDTAHRQDRSVEALGAARELTVELLSVDTTALDADLAAARALATGELAAHFDDVARPLIVPDGSAPGLVTRAEVVRAAVVSSDAEQTVVLVYLDRVSTSEQAPPRRAAAQVAVTVTDTDPDGLWRVSAIRAV